MQNMFNTPVESKDNSRLINEEGNYPVKIVEIAMVTPQKTEAVFKDGHQQIRVTGQSADGKIISVFLNCQPYAQYADLTELQKQSGEFGVLEHEGTKYAIAKATGKRVPIPMPDLNDEVAIANAHPKAKAVIDIYRGFGFNLGLTTFTALDFKGRECIFVVREEKSPSGKANLKVVSTRPMPSVKADVVF